MRFGRTAAGFVLAALVASCATLPRPRPPEVVATSVRVTEWRLPDVRLAVEVTLRNPNDRDLALASMDATIALGGAAIGRASLVRPVTLLARGEARVPLDVRGDASAAFAQIGAALGGAKPLDYEVSGALRLADGTVVPFRRRGTVPGER